MLKTNCFVVLSMVALASCAESTEPGEPGGSEPTLGEAEQAVNGVRYCDEDWDCSSACTCSQGTCQPSGFGPPGDPGICAQPPERACATAADCRSACDCTAGLCQPDGFGPPPPQDWCAQPPPDQYEYNDSLTSASSYLGAPQLHTFWDRSDEDFIWIYVPSAMTVTFDTSESAGTDMTLYRYDSTVWPPVEAYFTPIAYNDDKCGFWFSPYCWGSRITTAATPGLYAVNVRNQWYGSVYDQDPRSYVFQVW